jgi:hypothetical protein
MIKKYIKFVVGIALGFLLAVILLVGYVAFFPSDNPSKARLRFALNVLDKEQKRLGIQCEDGDKFILNYIDAVAPVIEKLGNGQRLSESDPIILQGSKVNDVMTSCAIVKNMTEADNSHILSNLALGDDSVRQEVTAIRIAISRTVAKWCGVDCIQDARKEILENSSLVRQRFVLGTKGTGVKLNSAR